MNTPPSSGPAPIVIEGAVKKRALAVIFFIMLMDIIGLTILIPVAPSIAARYSTSALTVTLLSGVYAGAQFFAAPALGNIGDRIGRRPVLLISVLGSAIGYFIFGIGGALWVLFLSRLIDGITGGNLSTATAYIADVSTPQERPKNFAMIGIAFGLGFILGPALATVTSSLISVDAPAFTAGILALISVGVMFFVLPESLPKEKRRVGPIRLTDFNPLMSIGDIARKPGMMPLLIISAVFAFAFQGVNSVFSKYIGDSFHVTPAQIGLIFLIGGVVTAVVQGTLVQRTVKRFGEKGMTIVSLLGLTAGYVLVVALPAYWLMFPTTLLRNGLGGFFWATMGALTASKVLPREQGKLSGVTTALQSLMGLVGPLAAGAAYDALSPSAPIWIGAGLFALAALITLALKPAPPQASAPQYGH